MSAQNEHYWWDSAEEDLVVAESLVSAGHYRYAAFLCHLAVEKSLKAVISRTGMPPRIHNLTRLAELAQFKDQMAREQFEVLDLLEPMNIEGRYPGQFSSMVTAELAAHYACQDEGDVQVDKGEVRERVRRFADKVRAEMPVRQIILFGSYVHGTPHEWSDIDVAVITEPVEHWLDTAASHLFHLRRDIDSMIEPILFDSEEDRSGFLAEIRRTGEIIYDRDAEQAA